MKRKETDPNKQDFYKLIFFTKTKLGGYYRYKDIFQIYPIVGKGFPQNDVQEHFPNYIEILITPEDNVTVQTPYPEMDNFISKFAPSVIKQDLILNLLTTCTNHLFFRYESKGLWALPIPTKKPKEIRSDLESEWCLPVYGSKATGENNVIINFTDLSHLKPIEKKLFTKYYFDISPDVYYADSIKMPSIIHGFFLSYFNLESQLKLVVNTAMYHLKNGVELSESKKSLSLISLFTSLETMVNLENKEFKPTQCDSCGQKKYSVAKKFRDFLTKYVSHHPESKSKFNKLYSLRSKIVHTGKTLKSEFLYSEASQEIKEEEKLKITEVIQYCRLSIVNWTIQNEIQSRKPKA